MNSPDHRLKELLSLAQRVSPVEPAGPEDASCFAQRTVSAWRRRRAAGVAPDSWRLWEQVGNWSLAAATALVIVAFLQPDRSIPPNPFDTFGPVDAEEFNLF
jgi:hypothetical protein